MKKIVAMFIMAIMALQVAFAGDVVTRDVSKLPAEARTTISKHFPDAKISFIKIEKDFFQSANYEATLTNGVEVDFNSKGEWLEVDCKKGTVPAAFIPAKVSSYVKSNFPNEQIRKIERGRKGYEVKLSNGLEVKFDPYGGFLKLDD